MKVAPLTAAALLLVASPASADQWSYMFDHGARWESCTVTFDGPRTKALNRAVRDVERASGLDLVRVPSGGQIHARHVRGPIADRAGEALIVEADGRYVSAEVRVWTTDTGLWSRRALWRHELGHALGLGHSWDPYDPMYAPTKTVPSPDWKASFAALYPECAS